MNNSEKVLKLLSSLIKNGILSTKDLQTEILTNLQFNKDKFIDKFQLVSKEEFEVLKKIVMNQEKEIKKLKKPKKAKKP
jgi:BMFP domain-containing protein YqiC|tara:strand:- start:120 stop:356 length:237 start_codon:yes stop_codon:yes gene_type:complete